MVCFTPFEGDARLNTASSTRRTCDPFHAHFQTTTCGRPSLTRFVDQRFSLSIVFCTVPSFQRPPNIPHPTRPWSSSARP